MGANWASGAAGVANAIANIGNAWVRAQQTSVRNNLRAQQASADRAMRHAAEEAEKNRQWQERMANTQYQRAMADMKKAGLNPILAFQQGGNAVPNGSSAGGYTINGAQGQITAGQRAMMAAPEILGVIQQIATNAFQRATSGKQKSWITSATQHTVNNVIDMVAGAQRKNKK